MNLTVSLHHHQNIIIKKTNLIDLIYFSGFCLNSLQNRSSTAVEIQLWLERMKQETQGVSVGFTSKGQRRLTNEVFQPDADGVQRVSVQDPGLSSCFLVQALKFVMFSCLLEEKK